VAGSELIAGEAYPVSPVVCQRFVAIRDVRHSSACRMGRSGALSQLRSGTRGSICQIACCGGQMIDRSSDPHRGAVGPAWDLTEVRTAGSLAA
jgi:hypothetical protein